MLASSNAETLRSLAEGLGLEWRAFGLEPSPAQLQSVHAVLHATGPFSAMAAPMAAACIAAGIHYCDITGRIDVSEALAGRMPRAGRSVMLPPGAGFDVVLAIASRRTSHVASCCTRLSPTT